MKRYAVCTLSALFLAAATASFAGKPITPEQAASFKIGEATEAEVTHALGKPITISADSDGQTILVYASSGTHVKAVTFVPIIGMFAGGAKGTTSVTSFTFAKDGRLSKYSSTNTQAECSALGGCVGSTPIN